MRQQLGVKSSLLERGTKKEKKGEAVGHQRVNKLPHSVNQTGETGPHPPVMKSLRGLEASRVRRVHGSMLNKSGPPCP